MSDFACSDTKLTALWSQLSESDKSQLDDALLDRAPSGTDWQSLSSTVLEFVHLFTDILGIDLDKPGFALVDIAPYSDDLSWAKGSIRIPQGDISVAWFRDDKRFTLNVMVPVGVHLRPILPARLTDTLICDGEIVPEDSIMRRDDEEAELCVMPGAAYRFDVVSAGREKTNI